MISFGEHDLVDLGSAKTCLSCKHYLSCTDKSKSFSYSCDKFRRFNPKDTAKQIVEETGSKVDYQLVLSSINEPNGEIAKKFSILNIIDGAIKSSPVVASDIKIPDGDFPEAKNFMEFTSSDKFLKQKPYLEQLIIGIMVFAEYCPSCSDIDYLLDTHKVDDSLARFRRKVCLLEHGKCPSCKKNRKFFVDQDLMFFYNEMAVCAGQRSGKSALTGMMVSYIVHRLIKLQNPNEVYGLMSSNVLHGTFCALTYKQAKDNLWDPIMGNILGSPWFQSYHEMLTSHSTRDGELVKLKDEFIMYNNRRFVMYPAGPDKRVLRGRTRIVGSVDELGWFDNTANSTKVKVNAREVYIALGNSLTTVQAKAEVLFSKGFYNILPGYFLNISSPSSNRDKIMELVRDAQGSRKLYGVLKPTWEMNPDIPKSALAEYFRKDPVAALRDFGVQPPLASNPFISNQEAVEKCITKKSNPLEVRHVVSKSKAKNGNTTRYGKFDFLKKSGFPSVLALDAGFSNNSFACAVAHLHDHRFPVIDCLVEIQPLPGVPVNFARLYTEIMLPLIEYRNVKLVAADRWNSLKLLHDVEEDTGVQTLIYSLKYKDMQIFKDHVLDNQVGFPKTEMSIEDIIDYKHSEYPACFKGKPASHFVLQSLTVQDTGSQVVKGDQLTDDLFRAGMLACQVLLDDAYAEYFTADNINKEVMRRNVADFAVFKGASGGGSGSAVGGGSSAGLLGSPTGSVIGMIKQRRDT